jgi:hypothetical protein
VEAPIALLSSTPEKNVKKEIEEIVIQEEDIVEDI